MSLISHTNLQTAHETKSNDSNIKAAKLNQSHDAITAMPIRSRAICVRGPLHRAASCQSKSQLCPGESRSLDCGATSSITKFRNARPEMFARHIRHAAAVRRCCCTQLRYALACIGRVTPTIAPVWRENRSAQCGRSCG